MVCSDLTANSSNSITQCAGEFYKLIKMLWILSCMALYVSTCEGQVGPTLTPYGSTQIPFTPTPFPSSNPTANTPTIAPTIPTVGPFGRRPFQPQFNPYNSQYNNQYYNNPSAGPAIPILTYSSEHVGDGTYSFSYSTADGKQAQESGFLKDAYIDNNGEPQGTQVVQGSYAYVAPDGTPVQVSYIADENGFRPSGVHIPATGKELPPPPFIDGNRNNIGDPNRRFNPFNRYDSYNVGNRYNHYNDRFNNGFDRRAPYDRRFPDNRYNDFVPLNAYNNPYRPAPTYGPSNKKNDQTSKTDSV